jgi:hypothetical protein
VKGRNVYSNRKKSKCNKIRRKEEKKKR